jgi:hypothetical protein
VNPDLGVIATARLAALHAAGDRVVVSNLVRLECRVGPLKSVDSKLLSRYDGFFALPGVEVVALNAAVCDRAAMIRATYGFRTPDALNEGRDLDRQGPQNLPLGDRSKPSQTLLIDLVVLCANCHVMVHRHGGNLPLDSLLARSA